MNSCVDKVSLLWMNGISCILKFHIADREYSSDSLKAGTVHWGITHPCPRESGSVIFYHLQLRGLYHPWTWLYLWLSLSTLISCIFSHWSYSVLRAEVLQHTSQDLTTVLAPWTLVSLSARSILTHKGKVSRSATLPRENVLSIHTVMPFLPAQLS